MNIELLILGAIILSSLVYALTLKTSLLSWQIVKSAKLISLASINPGSSEHIEVPKSTSRSTKPNRTLNTAVEIPRVVGPIPVTRDSYPFNAANRQFRPIDLASYNYIEEEFLISGLAKVYDWPGEVAIATGFSGPYTTRILVRKPANAIKFNGNVIVELANWARGYDVPLAAWGEYYDSLMARGDAWVQITMRPAVALRLKKFNSTRYAALSFSSPLPSKMRAKDPTNTAYPYPPSSKDTEDGLNWDIISQVGALLKSQGASNPLSGYKVKYLYLTGATGGDLATYVAAIHPNATLDGAKPIYDGYLIKMTGSPAPINQYAMRIDASDPRCKLHANVPIIRVNTQSDIFGFGEHPDWSYKQRRADSDLPKDRFRLYEVVGSIVGSKYPLLSGPNQVDVEATGEKWGRVEVPPYEFPLRYILNGALVNLDRWVWQDIAPPKANLMEVVNLDQPSADFVYDQFHNIKGGVRTPYVDVPIATYPKLGAIVPFDKRMLAKLYRDHDDYVNQVTVSANQLFKDGWVLDVLEADAQKIIDEAIHAEVP